MISGFGTYHTDKKGDNYSVISFDDVVNKANNPPSVAKADGAVLAAAEEDPRASTYDPATEPLVARRV